MPQDDHDYLAREARARVEIDRQLGAAGWAVQQADRVNFNASAEVAVREFVLEKGHGRVDYLLFIGGQPVGVIEAKPEGTTLTEVERQSGKYVEGLPDWIKPAVYPLPFIYESTGKETRFTNGYDPDEPTDLHLPSPRDARRVGKTDRRRPGAGDLQGSPASHAAARRARLVEGAGEGGLQR